MLNDSTTPRSDARRSPSAGRRWQLVVTSGPARGRVIALRPGELILGRRPPADVPLNESGVSRRHAKIVLAGDGRAVLVDLESTNGTFVNDSRIEVAALHHGHCIRLGPDAHLRVEACDRAKLKLRPRELDVARLVAQGATNPEIALRLGITARTVASHLENAYRRLGIGSRTELARLLGEAGLV